MSFSYFRQQLLINLDWGDKKIVFPACLSASFDDGCYQLLRAEISRKNFQIKSSRSAALVQVIKFNLSCIKWHRNCLCGTVHSLTHKSEKS